MTADAAAHGCRAVGAAQHAARRRPVDRGDAKAAVRSSAPWRARRGGERERVGDRIGHRLARDLERPVVAQPTPRTPFRARVAASATIALALAPRPAARISAPHRSTGTPERVDHRRRAAPPSARISSVSSSPGVRVEPGVQDPRVGAAGGRGPAPASASSSATDDTSPRERQRDRAADHAGADDRYLDVGSRAR